MKSELYDLSSWAKGDDDVGLLLIDGGGGDVIATMRRAEQPRLSIDDH